MPRASATILHCSRCHKVLAINEAVKCPKCKTINSLYQAFATELKPDQHIVSFLWRPDGGQASAIFIRKEVWFNVGRFPEIPREQSQFVVFHLYNYIDPSKAFSPTGGCMVNDPKQPYLKLEDALVVAQQMEAEALGSGDWVRVEDLKHKM